MARAKRNGSQDQSRERADAAQNLAIPTAAGTMLLGVLAAEADQRDAAHGVAQTAPDKLGDARHDAAQPLPTHDTGAPLPPQQDVISSHSDAALFEPQSLDGGINASHSFGPEVSADPIPAAQDAAPDPAETGNAPVIALQETGDHHADGFSADGHDAAASAMWASQLDHLLPNLSSTIDATVQSATHALDRAMDAVTPVLSQVQTTIQTTLGDTLHAAYAVGSSIAASAIDGAFSPNGIAALAMPHDSGPVPMIDTAAAVPDMLTPQPLHLGFLGQSVADAHDPHDGAFSNLSSHV